MSSTSLDHTFAIILAGGGGTRLWPKSRKETPKQFLKLTGKQTMVQVTANRLTKLVPWERVIVVTNERYKDEVKQELPEVPAENIIAEPDKKDTALAMLVGAMYAKTIDPEAIVINGASDHVVKNEAEFVRVMKAAVDVASKKEQLVTVGITPSFPSSAFGYIKVGSDVITKHGKLPVFSVDSFTEKPNKATAQAFISTGKYFWNANMYVWSTDTLLEAFQQHMPEMHEHVSPLLSLSGKKFHSELGSVYEKAESISIDYAISEKADNLVLIPGDFGWDDVGNWDVVYKLGKKDLAGNVIIGEGENVPTLNLYSSNNLIHTNGRLVSLIGINDMIVVDTDEIVLIAPKSQSQAVKKVVERLKEENKTEYL